MLKSGNYQMREIASIENAMQYKPFYTEHLDTLFNVLWDIASSDESDSKWEKYHKGSYQDNYQIVKDGKYFIIQYDLITESAILYEIRITNSMY